MSSSSQLTIERLQSSITYEEFLQRFLIPNRPCILPVELIQDWNAFKDWQTGTQKDECIDGLHPAFGILKRQCGDHIVPIVVERIKGDEGDEDADGDVFEREERSLDDAIAKMSKAKKQGNERIYIKDWHLVRQESTKRPGFGHKLYTTPTLFADDWMNNVESTLEDDFRFCYAGSAGTRTPIHRDVYTSYSWSTNLCGTKLWRLFPPEAKTYLRKYPQNANSGIASSVDEMQRLSGKGKLGLISEGKMGYPKWKYAMEKCYEIVQEQGETIFVPSDWYHEVINLTDCISLNHNWCNSCNIKSMYESMCEEVQKTEEAMMDVRKMMQDANPKDWEREWNETVQKVVVANAGWGWKGFWKMIRLNLYHPPFQQSFRPKIDFVRSQLLPCIDNFVERHDYHSIEEATKKAIEECKQLLYQI